METLLFTGFSAAGKSTIAQGFTKEFGFVLLEERMILHEIAITRGFNRTRDWIIQEGEEIVLQTARARTISRMKGMIGQQGVVVDGTYDRHLPLALREIFPNFRITIISVIIDDQERERRMSSRLGKPLNFAREEMTLIDGFKIRAGIEDIMKIADITINNTVSLLESVAILNQELKKLGIDKKQETK